MKTNEAPEKIYVADTTFPDYVDFDGSPINTKRIDEHDIEYTRTDAFIEKAVEYMISHIPDMHILGDSCKIDECIIEDFKNYMKGE